MDTAFRGLRMPGRRFPSALILVAALGAVAIVLPVQAQERPSPDPAEMAALIKQLGDVRWQVREDATERLIDYGPDVYEPLKKTLAETDSYEVRRRIRRIVEDVRLTEEAMAPSAFMGIQIDYNTARDYRLPGPNRGVFVSATIEGTAARRSGIQGGDIIVSLNGNWFSEESPSSGFSNWIASQRPGTKCKVGLLRGGEGMMVESQLSRMTPEEIQALTYKAILHTEDGRVPEGGAGLLIEQPGPTAQALDLRAGDLVLSLDGETIPAAGANEHFRKWAATANKPKEEDAPQQGVPLIPQPPQARGPRQHSMRVLRGGKYVELEVALGRRPKALRSAGGRGSYTRETMKDFSVWWHDNFDPKGLVTEGENRAFDSTWGRR